MFVLVSHLPYDFQHCNNIGTIVNKVKHITSSLDTLQKVSLWKNMRFD